MSIKTSDDAYSPFKAVRHLDIIEAARTKLPWRPAHVQIILSDLCNHSCDFCAYRDPSYTSSTMFYEVDEKNLKRGLRRDQEHPERNYNPNRQMPFGKVMEILEDCRAMNVAGIQFTGGGEPTVHPKWIDAIKLAVSYGLKTSLVTNGVNVGDAINTLTDLSWIRFSVDAGNEGDYAKIRHCPTSHWEKVWNNIERLSHACKLSSRKTPTIGVGFVVTPDNWWGIYSAAVLAKMYGADNIRISAQFSADEERRFTGFVREAAKLAKDAEALSDGRFKVFNRFSEKLDDLKQKRPDYDRCGYQLFTTYIGADLNLYRCCVYAYHPSGLYGSIKEQRFRDVWMNMDRSNEMHRFEAKSCERCQFNGINRFLDYVNREHDPDHSEFV